MARNKKLLTFLTICLIHAISVSAQTVKVKKEKAHVKGEHLEGFEVELEASLTELNTYYIKFLRSIGKLKQSDGLVVNEPNVNGLAYSQPLFASVKSNGTKSTAWIGINSKTWNKADAEKINKELEKIMYDFGVKFYRDRIQGQVDESLRAVQAVEKQQQRLVNENKNLNTKLEDNKREKLQLEKSLENNKLEYESLLLKIEQNKKAQDSVAVAREQVKKVVEIHREKQRKVN
jgi:hypothetical protein